MKSVLMMCGAIAAIAWVSAMGVIAALDYVAERDSPRMPDCFKYRCGLNGGPTVPMSEKNMEISESIDSMIKSIRQ